MAQKVSIFKFTSYRDYLKAHYEHMKEASPYFSYRQFALKAGYSSFSLYANIVKGIKNLTPKYLPGFTKALDLSPEEAEYFRLMMELDRTKSQYRSQAVFEKMLKLMPKKTRRLKSAQKELFSKWHHSAILQALNVLQISDNIGDISKWLVPHVKTVEIKKSIKLLKELGLIVRDNEGFLRPSDSDIVGGSEVGSIYINQFQDKMLELARDAFEEFKPSKRYYITETFSISQECSNQMDNKIKEFHKEIANMILNDKNKAEKIMQMNLQYFPLCKRSHE